MRGLLKLILAICKSNVNAATEIATEVECLLSETALLKLNSDDRTYFLGGLQETARESFAESEKLVLDVSSDKLGIQITPDTIERTHRILRFYPDKNRSITFEVYFLNATKLW